MNPNEFIICSAIYLDDGFEHPFQPSNIKTGIVISGRRHKNCYYTIKHMPVYIRKIKEDDKEITGFITSNNRFVDRKEAFRIAKTEHQITHHMFDNDDTGILTSEDLY